MRRPKIVVTPPGPRAREIIEKDHSLLSPSLTRTSPLVGFEAEGAGLGMLMGTSIWTSARALP